MYSKPNTLTLTFQWDTYDAPCPAAMFGLDATLKGLSKTLLFPAKADVAWQWLEDEGYVAKSWSNGERIACAGYIRPVTVTFRLQA